jgi:hypothetical protein
MLWSGLTLERETSDLIDKGESSLSLLETICDTETDKYPLSLSLHIICQLCASVTESNRKMTDISPPMSILPLDVLRDCMDYLPLKDILTCQRVNLALDDIIRHSSDLRLRRHLGENGIQPDYQAKSQDHHAELYRLQEIENRLSNIQFGRSFPNSETYQVSATNAPDMHLIAIADSDVFLPISQEADAGIIGGIAKYSLSDCKKAPEILQFGRIVRHYQVEPAEGVLLVVFLDEG